MRVDGEEKIKEIENMLRQRRQGIEPSEPDDGALSEREEAIRQINLRRQKEMMNDEQDARISAEMAEEELEDALIAEEQRRWEEEMEVEADFMDSDIILDTFKEEFADVYPSILFALRTGLRIGEIQALKWSDIDFDSRQIEVKRAIAGAE